MTSDRIAAKDRVAPASDHVLVGPVTLVRPYGSNGVPGYD